jgi:hypothetical protein
VTRNHLKKIKIYHVQQFSDGQAEGSMIKLFIIKSMSDLDYSEHLIPRRPIFRNIWNADMFVYWYLMVRILNSTNDVRLSSGH